MQPGIVLQQIWTTYKKPIIIVAVILFIIFSLTLVRNRPTKTAEQGKSTAKSKKATTQPPDSELVWIAYEEPLYILQYPNSLRATKGDVEDGVESLTIYNPKNLNYKFTLDMTKDKTIETRIHSILRSYNYTESTVTVDDIKALQFKGSQVAASKTHQQIVTVFSKSDTVYQFLLDYESSARIKEYDELYPQILETVDLN